MNERWDWGLFIIRMNTFSWDISVKKVDTNITNILSNFAVQEICTLWILKGFLYQKLRRFFYKEWNFIFIVCQKCWQGKIEIKKIIFIIKLTWKSSIVWPHKWFVNQAKNIPVVLPSSTIKIWVKLAKEFMSYDRKYKQTDIKTKL